MAKSRTFASGTVIILTAKASITSGDPALLQYSWRKDGVVISNITTSGTATLSTLTAGVYDVVVSHPNADSVTSESFTVALRAAKAILRITRVKSGSDVNDDGSFPSSRIEQFDWNLASSSFEAKSESSGFWQVYAKEQDISVDLLMKGSSGHGYNFGLNGGGDGGVGTIRYTLQKGVIHTLRPGDRRQKSSDDPENNAPNGGRVFTGKGGFGGGATLLYRGGTLIAVVGGGGGDGIDNDGGDGGGFNVAGSSGSGRNGGSGAQSVPPINISNGNTDNNQYPQTGVITIGRCVTAASTSPENCSYYRSSNGAQNNGGFGYSEGGGGGSGAKGGSASLNRDGGGGGSGWASSAVSVVSTQLGGNPAPNNGSITISRVV